MWLSNQSHHLQRDTGSYAPNLHLRWFLPPQFYHLKYHCLKVNVSPILPILEWSSTILWAMSVSALSSCIMSVHRTLISESGRRHRSNRNVIDQLGSPKSQQQKICSLESSAQRGSVKQFQIGWLCPNQADECNQIEILDLKVLSHTAAWQGTCFCQIVISLQVWRAILLEETTFWCEAVN